VTDPINGLIWLLALVFIAGILVYVGWFKK
jgi:hypothetical protein